MNRIVQKTEMLQMPDNVFGVRWPIIFSGRVSDAIDDFHISDQGLPDHCVLWEIVFQGVDRAGGNNPYFRYDLRLGDHRPANAAEFNAMERVFTPSPDTLIADEYLYCTHNFRSTMKLWLQPQGRRFVLRIGNIGSSESHFTLFLVVSAIPRTIPDHPLEELVREQVRTLDRIERLKKI